MLTTTTTTTTTTEAATTTTTTMQYGMFLHITTTMLGDELTSVHENIGNKFIGVHASVQSIGSLNRNISKTKYKN